MSAIANKSWVGVFNDVEKLTANISVRTFSIIVGIVYAAHLIGGVLVAVHSVNVLIYPLVSMPAPQYIGATSPLLAGFLSLMDSNLLVFGLVALCIGTKVTNCKYEWVADLSISGGCAVVYTLAYYGAWLVHFSFLHMPGTLSSSGIWIDPAKAVMIHNSFQGLFLNVAFALACGLGALIFIKSCKATDDDGDDE